MNTDEAVQTEQQRIIRILDEMADEPKWRAASPNDEIRHFVGHAKDRILTWTVDDFRKNQELWKDWAARSDRNNGKWLLP